MIVELPDAHRLLMAQAARVQELEALANAARDVCLDNQGVCDDTEYCDCSWARLNRAIQKAGIR